MISALRRLTSADPDTLLREALGLSLLIAAILAGLFLPALA